MATLINTLPEEKIAYLLKNGEGPRYLFGRQVATIMANKKSTGDMFEIVLLAGGKGDSFPLHYHKETHEGILVLDGKVELVLNVKSIFYYQETMPIFQPAPLIATKCKTIALVLFHII